jgi:dihydrofolate reductase
MLSLIWAMDKNQLIGNANALPWRLPADLAFFKSKTQGHPVIMGRKTYDSLGRPLPNRENIVLTRDNNVEISGCSIANSVHDVVELVKGKDAFVIGGAEIYKLFLPLADELVVTFVAGEFYGDTYFPTVDFDQWEIIEEIDGVVDEKNIHPHKFVTYARIK